MQIDALSAAKDRKVDLHQRDKKETGSLREMPLMQKRQISLAKTVRYGEIERLIPVCQTVSALPKKESPDAEKFKIHGGVCYSESDFIDYLNQYVFPKEKSEIVENLGWTELGNNLPKDYRQYPYFNF